MPDFKVMEAKYLLRERKLQADWAKLELNFANFWVARLTKQGELQLDQYLQKFAKDVDEVWLISNREDLVSQWSNRGR